MTLTVAAVKSDHNMTYRHELRSSPQAQRLKPGQCFVAFNSLLTIARIIDFMGGIHDYYAPDGEQFDTQMLSNMMQKGIGVEFTIDKKKAKQLESRDGAGEISKAA